MQKKTQHAFEHLFNNKSIFFLLEDQAKDLASTVSVDKTNFSVSFNEFLKLMSEQQESEPDEEALVQVFAISKYMRENV